MLEIYDGTAVRFCDGISRRNVLKVGVLTALGLTLPDLLRMRQAGAERGASPERNKAVILLWQHGGPSHIDSYDPKPEVPTEIRGPYTPIATNVDGVRISNLLP